MQPSARSYQQIYDSLGSVYDPQVNLVRQQQNDIPGQLQADEQGLAAKQNDAFDSITNGARQRGLGFSGIPIGEQAKYTATNYLPALANMRNDSRNRATSLESSIYDIMQKRSQQAQGQYQYDSSLAEQKRQFDAQQAASSASAFSPSFGGATPTANAQGPKSGSATAVQRGDKGFNYFDAAGRPISAAAYAAAKGVNIRDVLTAAAKAGDKGSQTALGFVGGDGGYDPRKITNQSLADLYNALVWDTGRKATYKAPSPSQGFTPPTAFSGFVNPLALKR